GREIAECAGAAVAAEERDAQRSATNADIGTTARSAHVDEERVDDVHVATAVEPGTGPERGTGCEVHVIGFGVQLLGLDRLRRATAKAGRVAHATGVEVGHPVHREIRAAALAEAVIQAQLTVVIALVAEAILPVGARCLVAGPVVILGAIPWPGPEIPSI